MKLTYPAIFMPCEEDEKGYTVVVPDLRGCVSEGDDFTEAYFMGQDAAAGWIVSAIEYGEEIPPASDINDIETEEGEFVNYIGIDIDYFTEKFAKEEQLMPIEEALVV